MTAALKAQLLASMRKGVEELDGKIAEAMERAKACTKAASMPMSHLSAEAWDKVVALQDERDALIERIEQAEEADDLMNDFLNAINDAYDGEALTVGSLQAQLDNHGLVVSRAPATIETKVEVIGHGGDGDRASTTTLKSTQTLQDQVANWRRVRETIRGWRK